MTTEATDGFDLGRFSAFGPLHMDDIKVTVEFPPEGQMWIGVLSDGLVKPVPRIAPRGLSAMERGFIRDFKDEGARIIPVPEQEFPERHHVYYRDGEFSFVPMVQPRIHDPLQEMRDEIAWLMSPGEPDEPQLIDRLDKMERDLSSAQTNVTNGLKAVAEGGDPVSTADDGDGIPASFRGLMVDGESAEKFTERMRRRWQYLKHLQMDGSKPTPARSLPDMTDEEQAELSDLEERNKQSGGMRWLD